MKKILVIFLLLCVTHANAFDFPLEGSVCVEKNNSRLKTIWCANSFKLESGSTVTVTARPPQNTRFYKWDSIGPGPCPEIGHGPVCTFKVPSYGEPYYYVHLIAVFEKTGGVYVPMPKWRQNAQ